MSDDEPYDADGDVGRFLQCPSPGGHMFPLSEPEGTLGDLFPYAPDFGLEAPAAIYGAEDHQLPVMDDVDDQYQEMAIDVQPPHMRLAPEMQPGYGFFPDPTLVQGDGGVHGEHYYQVPITDSQHHAAPTINNSGHHEAPPPVSAERHQDQEPNMDAEHYGAAIVDGERRQIPAMDDDVGQYEAMAMDVVQHPGHMMMAQETQDPTPMQGDGSGVDAVHHEAPPQYDAMAMDIVPQAAPWLEGSSMFPDPPSPTMCRMLDELTAMLHGVDGGGDDAAGGGAEAVEGGGDNAAAGGVAEAAEGGGDNAAAGGAEADARDDVGPADEEVKFKLITHGQLDCARCRSVREVLAIDWPSKIHFAVHSTYPETFEHAVTHRMLMGEDGQFHTYALLYMDLRGRRQEWVENFIAKSVDTMKRRNAGMVQDTNDPSTSSAPQPSNHGHMGLEVGMLNNLLSATAATDQAANPLTAQPVQEQGNTDTPPVAEAQVNEAASPEAAVQPAVMQAQDNTDALSVAEAAAPEAAEPAVTQAQEVPEVAQPATSRAETRTDALDKFPPCNWEGFKPDVLESSQVEPYDPASGVNVLMYPSMLEQLQLEELKKKESKKLSKMTVEDTPDYLNINDDHYANAPNFASATFKLLCQKDPTYRMFKRRVSGLNRKIKKLEQGANRVGTGGLVKIKQKMETCKQEKEELYDVIKRGMQDLENERRNNDGAGPSNHAAGPSNSSPGPSNGAGPSNVAGTSSNDTSPSNVSGNSNDGAGPSNVAGTSNMDAAGPSSAAGPSNVAVPSGTK